MSILAFISATKVGIEVCVDACTYGSEVSSYFFRRNVGLSWSMASARIFHVGRPTGSTTVCFMTAVVRD